MSVADKQKSGAAKFKPAKKANDGKKKMGNSDRRNVWLIVLSAFLVVGSIIAFMPPQERINQGLDIQGGLSVVLTAKNDDGSAITDEQMEKSRAIIENRVNALGASETVVQQQGNDQILVQIPGLSDTETALSTIGKTGKLEFARLDSFTDADVVEKINNGQYASEGTITDAFGNSFSSGKVQHLMVEPGTYNPIVTGEQITLVNIDRATETGTDYAVNVTLNSEGASAFAQATRELVADHGKIVIVLDGEVQSAPAVQSEIPNGNVSITGGYSLEEAQGLETILESGSLPISFEYAQSQVVGPTLGQDALRSGVMVALAGLALVMLYLLFFYKGLGLITAAAMGVFAMMYMGILAVLSMLGLFSLSLAGLAGVVLTIGMAADSSILTLERFREEIRMGRSIRSASISGVKHGILTSIDADLVTLVSALTLFFLASASVKGFGMTLALGIMCDIVMMLIFKAPIIRLLAPKAIANNPGFWGVKDGQEAASYFTGEEVATDKSQVKGRFIKKDFDFLGKRKIFLIIAAVCIVAVGAIVGIKGVNLGIEFVGGTSITFHGTGDVTTEELRSTFAQAGQPEAVIQTTNADGEEGFLVRMTVTSAEEAAGVANQVAKTYGWTTSDFEVTTIGPDWGASVIQSSLIAFLVSLILIILYITFRFKDYKMGVTAVITLIHDLAIVLGVYVLIGREVTPNTIAALLTILGYSLYDTVVVFHRINENMSEGTPKCTFMSMANHSINEVIIRSLNTSVTSLIPVVAMLIFGGETLRDFALAMTIGLVVGCYSSIAIATPIYSIWKTAEEKFAKLQKKYGADVQLFFLNRLPEAQKKLEAVAAPAEAAESAEAAVAPKQEKAAKAPEPKLTASQRRRQAQKNKE